MSPFVFDAYNDEDNHFLALSNLFYFQNIFAIELFKAGEAGPHASIETTTFFFLDAIG
jgi:hypothetical protein